MEKPNSRIICQWKVRKKNIEIIFERVVYAVAFINVINESNILNSMTNNPSQSMASLFPWPPSLIAEKKTQCYPEKQQFTM